MLILVTPVRWRVLTTDVRKESWLSVRLAGKMSMSLLVSTALKAERIFKKNRTKPHALQAAQ